MTHYYNELESHSVSQRQRDLAVFAAAGAAIICGIPIPKVVFFTPSSSGAVANKTFSSDEALAGQARVSDPTHIFVREGLSLADMCVACAHEVKHLQSFRDAAERLHKKGVSDYDPEIAEREARAFESRFQELAAPVLGAIREKSADEARHEKAQVIAEILQKADDLRRLLAA
jgi:hypothetical protein